MAKTTMPPLATERTTVRVPSPSGTTDVAVAYRPGRGERRFLLIHGNPGSVDHWNALAPLLEPHGDLLAFDLPGFGKSPTPSFAPTLDNLADVAFAVGQLFASAGAWTVLGHSHGGAVAQTFAARHPKAVRELVCLATTGYPASQSYFFLTLPGLERLLSVLTTVLGHPYARPMTRAIIVRTANAMFSPDIVPAEFIADEMRALADDPRMLRQRVRSMIGVTRGRPSDQLLSQCTSITAPTLFLHGSADVFGTPGQKLDVITQRMRSLNRDVSVQVLDRMGHMFPIHRPELVESALSAWWRRSH